MIPPRDPPSSKAIPTRYALTPLSATQSPGPEDQNTQLMELRWTEPLIIRLLHIISSSPRHRQALFPSTRASSLPIWVSTRDVCIELLTSVGESDWFQQQAKMGRVLVQDARWMSTKKWNASFLNPVKSKLDA